MIAVPGSAGAALYPCRITHVRTTPIRNRFSYRSYLWLVDPDDPPRLPGPFRWLADFRAADHLGDAAGSSSIRQNLDRYLATEGIDLRGGPVRLLTAARVFGYVFNPLSVYWCHDPDGRVVCVVAEVHNTYGGRHCYLIRPDEHGRAEIDKDFYVSPFEPARGGRYRMSLAEPHDVLSLGISLHRPGQAPFVTTVRGHRRPVTGWELFRTVLRHPLAPLMVSWRIRRQGIGLLVRGLRIVARPAHRKQEAVQ